MNSKAFKAFKVYLKAIGSNGSVARCSVLFNVLIILMLMYGNICYGRIIEPVRKIEGKYLSIASANRGECLNGSAYNVIVYDISQEDGDEFSLKLFGESTASSVAMAAAWYNSSDISAESFLQPALFTGTIPMKTRDADGIHQLKAVEGATYLAVTIIKKTTIVFVPKGDSFLRDPAEFITGTLPVMYVTTTDSVPITSKDYYLEGTYYLDNMGLDGFESIGSRDNQLPLQIKGRGNASWKMEKKPYRIKLDKKQPLVGFKKNKHFNLMAHAEDGNAYQLDEIGFTLSKLVGMEWTPSQQPIELVLNGDYVGLYWVAEKIRVEPDRVNIVEQKDEETDPELITGGWLIEIDNYDDEAQIVFTESNGNLLRITHHTPEVLSDAQRDYLSQMITTIDQLIYVEDKNDTRWEQYIDIDELAKFYIINEILDNCESFSGSCYLHKDLGEDSKFKFGPCWDFGSIASHWRADSYNYFIYEHVQDYVTSHWIGEILKFPRFQQKVRQLWTSVYPDLVDQVHQHCLEYVDYITPAINADYRRWRYEAGTNIPYRKVRIWSILAQHWAFLEQQWNPTSGKLCDLLASEIIKSGDTYRINDNLHVVAVSPDKKTLYCKDENGNGNLVSIPDGQVDYVSKSYPGLLDNIEYDQSNWIALTLSNDEEFDDGYVGCYLNDVVGVVDNLANPALALSTKPLIADRASTPYLSNPNTYVPMNFSGRGSIQAGGANLFLMTPQPMEVARVVAYWDGEKFTEVPSTQYLINGKVYQFNPYSQDFSFAFNRDLLTEPIDLNKGSIYSFNALIRKEDVNPQGAPWLVKSGSGYSIYPIGSVEEIDISPVVTGVDFVSASTVSSIHYYNLSGCEIAKPQSGVNIVVVEYSNGTKETKKVVF